MYAVIYMHILLMERSRSKESYINDKSAIKFKISIAAVGCRGSLL
jgi:hypothetical protein